MSEKNERSPQEYAYIMDGITTRMQMSIRKISQCSMLLCLTLILVVLIVVSGFLFNNKMMIDHITDIRAAQAGEVSHAEVSQLGQGAGN